MSFLESLQKKATNLTKLDAVVKRVQGVGFLLEVSGTEYEFVTADGSTIEKDEKSSKFYKLIHPVTRTPVCQVMSNKIKYNFVRISSDEYSKKKKEGSTIVHAWYNMHYEEIKETPIQAPLEIPGDLLLYTPALNLTRPTVDVIEAAEDSKLYDVGIGISCGCGSPSSSGSIGKSKLYLGSQDAAANEKGLRENNVTHVLNVATGVSYSQYENINYKIIPIIDTPESKINDYFEEAFKFIEEGVKSGGVLVHCNAGVSRSVSIIIGYIITKEKLSFDEILQKMKSVKKDVRPNEGFTEQLKHYQKTIIQ